MTDRPSAGTGTVMRADTFRAYAAAAGFGNAEIFVDLEHDTLRFYRLTP